MRSQREPRALRLMKIQVRSARSGVFDAMLRNLSSTGLSATLDKPASIGERLVFELNGIGTVVGTVRWINCKRVGVSLETVINPARVVYEPPIVETTAPAYADLVLGDAGSGRRPGLKTR